jgi:neurofibromin 1
MGLVAATCFQHNPATQPQAFTVLGHLAQDEVDDDIVYQILVAMSTTLVHYSETDNVLLVSMLRCLCRIIPGLTPDSRYAGSLFWLAIAILQLGHIPPFAAALKLLLVSLRHMTFKGPMVDTLLEARTVAIEPARRLDSIAGVAFDSDPGFSFVGVVYKGVRHPGTRRLAVEVMVELLKVCQKTRVLGPKGRKVAEDGVGLFMALLPLLAGTGEEEVKGLFSVVGEELQGGVADLKVLDLLTLP